MSSPRPQGPLEPLNLVLTFRTELSAPLTPDVQPGPNCGFAASHPSFSLVTSLQPEQVLGQEVANASRRKQGPRSQAGFLVHQTLAPKPWEPCKAHQPVT